MLVSALYTMWGSGVAKLLGSGLGFLTGEVICAHTRLQGPDSMWPEAARWFAAAGNPVVPPAAIARCAAASALTLAFEVLAPPLVLLWPRHRLLGVVKLRNLWVMGSIAMHLGIAMLMFPQFTRHSWCYLLCIEWPGEEAGEVGDRPRAARRETHERLLRDEMHAELLATDSALERHAQELERPASSLGSLERGGGRGGGGWSCWACYHLLVCNAWLLTLAATMVLRLELWPLSIFPLCAHR